MKLAGRATMSHDLVHRGRQTSSREDHRPGTREPRAIVGAAQSHSASLVLALSLLGTSLPVMLTAALPCLERPCRLGVLA